MIDPLFWLGLSILFVAASLAAVLVAVLPAVRELARAARSAEKLFDTLSRELPPTLEAIRLTGMEITDLTDDLSDGVQSAGRVVKQVDQSLGSAKQQAKQAKTTTRSMFVGMKTAWRVFRQSPGRRSPDRLSAGSDEVLDFDKRYSAYNPPPPREVYRGTDEETRYYSTSSPYTPEDEERYELTQRSDALKPSSELPNLQPEDQPEQGSEG